jgi:hypothetical protein
MKYVPKNKRSIPFEALTGEFQVANSGVPYVGQVVQISNGKYYAHEQGDLNTKKRLRKITDEAEADHFFDKDNIVPRGDFYYEYITQKGSEQSYPDEIPPARYYLSKNNYAHGTYVRYFVKNKVTNSVFEVNPSSYRELEGKSLTYHWPSYDITKLEWKITGDVADKEISGYLVDGVETLNKKSVEEASKIIPEIKSILTDYLQFHN